VNSTDIKPFADPSAAFAGLRQAQSHIVTAMNAQDDQSTDVFKALEASYWVVSSAMETVDGWS
jgi:hypothetical protein